MNLAVDIRSVLSRLHTMSHEEMAETLVLLEELENRKRLHLARNDFLAFIGLIDPTYKFGTHLKRLGALLMQIEAGVKDRIAVSMAPRMGKSLMISIYYPAWYLGKHPDHKLIMASHTSDLAVDMARKVRNLMQSDEYKAIFPQVQIAADAKAAGKWNTSKGGEVFAVGVGGAIAGRGADLIVADDPLSEQDLRAGNTDSLDTVYEWFRAGLRTRLMPGGKIAILHCLVGGTRITLGDGSEKLLRDIRPGDMVASYENGTFKPAKVLGWANQGLDRIYTIALQSGNIIRGNERHPLLVRDGEAEKWVKIRDLKPGMKLVSARGVLGHLTIKPSEDCARYATTESGGTRKPQDGCQSLSLSRFSTVLPPDAPALPNPLLSPDCVSPAKPESGTTKNTRGLQKDRWDITVSGKVSSALQRAVKNLYTRMACAVLVGIRLGTQSAKRVASTIAPINVATPTSKLAMGSLALNTTGYLPSKKGSVLFVASRPRTKTPPRNGRCAASQLTTAILQAKLEPSFATPATSLSKTETPLSFCDGPLSTLSATLDEILSITLDGEEDVFDIQVEGTENFLANGVVSHNTRWHQRDLIGRLIKDSAMNPDADQYEVFEFPAILTVPNPEYDPDNPDAEDNPKEILKSLWPEQWSVESLLRTKASMPAWQWNAQYMQQPTAQEAAIIKRDHIRWWQKETPPQCAFTVQSWDTAMTTKERSDYSVCQTWGVWTTEEGVDNVILLNSVRGKYEFPELKKVALQQVKDWEPDALIVEAKASGQPLIDELRRSGIYVQDFSPGKGQDKIARVNAIADMFASGQIWFPETWWAEEVVEELLAFPSGEHDDLVDALTLALRRVRQGGLLRLTSDHDDDPQIPTYRKKVYY